MKMRMKHWGVCVCAALVLGCLCNCCEKDPLSVSTDQLLLNAVTDYDGNTYYAVKLGNQVWMASNLKTTHYADGTPISQGSSASYDVAYWYYPDDNSSNKATYGLLYNWTAVMGNFSSSSSNPSEVQGICPDGWHLPSDAEWSELEEYVSSQSEYYCDTNTFCIAKALASSTGWHDSSSDFAVGNNQASNNATGFSALPAGCYSCGSYYNFGDYVSFWSATEASSDGAYLAYCRSLNYFDAVVHGGNTNKPNGFSVRCLRD